MCEFLVNKARDQPVTDTEKVQQRTQKGGNIIQCLLCLYCQGLFSGPPWFLVGSVGLNHCPQWRMTGWETKLANQTLASLKGQDRMYPSMLTNHCDTSLFFGRSQQPSKVPDMKTRKRQMSQPSSRKRIQGTTSHPVYGKTTVQVILEVFCIHMRGSA